MKNRTLKTPSRTPEAPSNSDEETNFRLLTGGGGGDLGNSSHTGEEDVSDEEEEDGDSEASDDEGAVSPEITTREDMKKELSSMSFEDILKLQSRVGTRVFNEVAYGSEQPEGSQKKKKRLNKNRPAEVSTKKPAPFLRQVVPVRKAVVRDPRFDDLSGEYKPEIFEKTFKFIDDIKHREREMVQKQLRRTKNKGRKEKLQLLLRRMENQERAKKDREQQRERDLQLRKQQRERADGGAPPFFLKNSERRQLQLAEKFQGLKQSGRLETFLSRRRRRNASKDRRRLPPQQPRTRTRT